jgi:hypothetical protein
MSRRPARRAAIVLLVALGGCGARAADDPVLDLAGGSIPTAAPSTTAADPIAPTSTTAPAPPPPTTTTTVDPDLRIGAVQDWVPYAVAGDVELRHPSNRVERIGFHESANDGARVQTPLPTAVRPTVLESRERDTPAATAADIVVQPGTPIRAPVTGTVKRGGPYTLYCDTPDEYVVIEPDAHPGWEVKVLHMQGVGVRKGDRVTAGVTEVAARAHQLPFESQVDEDRAWSPAWPHVHVEVVDPSIPDRPTPGAGC